VLEVDEGVSGPEAPMQFLSRDQFAGPLDQRGQQPERLILDVDRNVIPPQLARACVELERPEADDGQVGRACDARILSHKPALTRPVTSRG
jgi:hypothetical protein